MAIRYRLQQPNQTDAGDGGEGADSRPNPGDVNASGNRARLNRMEEISRVADGRRAAEMMDVEGERASGRFAGGEFDDSAEARERAAEQAELEAQQAREEQAERARLEQEEADREARRLQEEGTAGDGAAPGNAGGTGDEQDDAARSADERVVDGVRYYRTIVSGQERWLTLTQLREGAGASLNASETLQRAQEALQRASQAALTPKEGEAEDLSDEDLENIILSASTGDEEAVRKLAQVVRKKPSGPAPQDISRQVAQQIATQREVDRGEEAVKDLLSNATLAPVFRQRLNAFGTANPTSKIADAYRIVGEQMRKDFAPMLSQDGVRTPPNKLDRKRTIVNPPTSAGRQQRREEADREVPVGDEIDAIARSRGQQRAHRVRRS